MAAKWFMSGWRNAGALTAIAVAFAVATAACARSDALGDEARQMEPDKAKAMDQAYWQLLKTEKCARRATDQQAVAEQLYRTSQIAARAQAAGLGQRLLDTQAKWSRFDETADWVCGKGDPLAGLTGAVDAFDRTVAQALADG